MKKLIVALGASAPVLLAGNVLAATQPSLPLVHNFVMFSLDDAGTTNTPLQLYAMSPLQEIPPDPVIPEPTTIIASLLVGAGLLPLKRRRQKTK